MERLDSFNKILLATGTINYLASMINGVNSQLKMTKLANDPIHKEGIEERDAIMGKAVELLKETMEILGNALEEQCEIDIYVTTPAFQVITHGHDEVDGDFDNL